MYNVQYIFDINQQNYNIDKHFIDSLNIDGINYILDCFKRYVEIYKFDKVYSTRYIINHTYLYLLQINSNDLTEYK